jgi:hypothetical protein
VTWGVSRSNRATIDDSDGEPRDFRITATSYKNAAIQFAPSYALWAIVIIGVMLIRQLSRSSHKQFAWVRAHDRSTLIRNSNKRSVIVHTTPPGRRVNCLSTNRHKRKQEGSRGQKSKGYFHLNFLPSFPSQNVHSFRCIKGARATCPITSFIKSLCACHGRGELRF